jgi:DNA-binding MarR family transcriptional regulator
LLWEVAKAGKPHLEAIAAEADLTPTQAWSVKVLAAAEPPTMSALAASLSCDASSVTAIVDRLEDRGFVERRPAAHDRRVKVLVLTAAGRALHDVLAARMEQAPPVIANLTSSEQRALRDLLRRALAALEPASSRADRAAHAARPPRKRKARDADAIMR